jgi:endo-1,4-beta-mannosidase
MTFELGINYWPKRSAMWMWREFDIGEVRDDMAQIANIGFGVVRFFAMTRDFLPAPMTVAPQMIRRLEQVAVAARDAGLKSMPTLVTINMSGRFWWPQWMIDSAGVPANLFSDPEILRSQALLVGACAGALSGDESIRAFDLSNEIDDAQQPLSRDAGWLWASLLANAIRRAAPGIPVQIGAHLLSLTTPEYLRIDDLAGVADDDVMHAYPLYCRTARSFLDPELVPFSCALTSGLAGNARPTLMQEFGLCTAPPGSPGVSITDDFLGRPLNQYLASEDEAATYYSEVLERLFATGAAGAYAWCHADYDPRLFDRSPISTAVRERTFGIVRSDGSEKPAADVFRKFAQRRDAAIFDQPAVAIPQILDVSADEYYSAPQANFDRLYAKWLSGIPS